MTIERRERGGEGGEEKRKVEGNEERGREKDKKREAGAVENGEVCVAERCAV